MTASHPHDEQLLTTNGVELCIQAFGDPAAPALLLIGGAEASMDWWDDDSPLHRSACSLGRGRDTR
jgi:hypothetical protein